MEANHSSVKNLEISVAESKTGASDPGCFHEQEKELLLMQVSNLQEELDRYFVENQSLREELRSSAELISVIQPRSRRKIAKARKILFDSGFYQSQVGTRLLPGFDYSKRGWRMGAEPHPLFDSDYYLDQLLLTRDQLLMSPLDHYLRLGSRIHVSPHPEFDSNWYRINNLDVVASGTDLLVHYLTLGWQEGRTPNRNFNGDWYLDNYPDVAEANLNPLLHFQLFGRKAGRKQRPESS